LKLYQIGLKNLKRRKVRTSLITIGLALAVAIEVALIGITKSLESDFSKKLDEYGANILILPKTNDLSLDYGGLPVSGVSFGGEKLSMSDVEKIRTIKNSENISTVAPQLFHVADVQSSAPDTLRLQSEASKSHPTEKKAIVAGIDFKSEFRLKRWWRYNGKIPDNAHDVLVGSSAAKAFPNGIHSDNLKPGDNVEIDGNVFNVAALLAETGSQDDKLIFVSLPVVQNIFKMGNEVSLIEVSALCYNCPIEEIVRQIKEKLPNATVTPLRQAIESRMDMMRNIEHFSMILSTAVALFAALMIFVNMMSSVTEREKEIGIFRTVGFKRRHVLAVLVFESLVVSLSAGILGYIAGLSAAYLARPLMGFQTLHGFGIDAIFTALSLAIIVGVSAAIYPAYKAARLEPTVALRAL